MKGLDTAQNCTNKAEDIKKLGYDFVCRYYNVNDKSKNLTRNEASALTNAGLSIVSVWENGYPTSDSYFSYDKGQYDGKHAFECAQTIQEEGTPIFFAVDYYAQSSKISSSIKDYFNGVIDAINDLGGSYPVGVYGSGSVCSYLYNNTNVGFTWLAQSMGWSGSRDYTDWDIKQGRETTIAGLDCDSDTCNSSNVMFSA